MGKKLCLFGLLTISAFMLPSCGDDGPLDSGNGENNSENELHIYAKVENAIEYNDVVEVKLMVFDLSTDRYIEIARGDWKDGGFTIELPKTLDPNYLHSFIRYDGLPSTITHVQPTLTICNKNIKIVNAVDFIGFDKDGKEITRFYPFKADVNGNANEVRFLYADSDATISGYLKTEVAISEFDRDKNADIKYIWEKTMNFSLKWKKGWNTWFFSESYTDAERTVIEQWTTISIDELKWSRRIYEN